MGLSLIDALVIQTRGDDVRVEAGGPSKENGKYTCWINLYNGEDFHRPIVNTQTCFDTAKAAENWGREFVDKVRAMKLDNPFDKLPDETKEAVQEIAQAAQSR